MLTKVVLNLTGVFKVCCLNKKLHNRQFVNNHKYVILLSGWCCLGSTEKNTFQPLGVLVRHDHFEKKMKM